jgi:glucose-inhibited division protein A
VGTADANRQTRICRRDEKGGGNPAQFAFARRHGYQFDFKDLKSDRPVVCGVETQFGVGYGCKAVILTTGTFLNGKIWVGNRSVAAGRAGEFAVTGLTETLNALGFVTGRLKTGTPARVDRRSVDFSKMRSSRPMMSQTGLASILVPG